MFDEVYKLIEQNDTFLIVSHISPDGDTLGSALAFAGFLRNLHKKVYLYCNDKIPEYFDFIKETSDYVSDLGSIKAQAVVSVDCSDLERTGLKCGENNEVSDDVLLNIDHHISNTNYAKYNVVDSTASATAEIIYDIIKNSGITMNKELSELIYIGISTDTGNFSYQNVTPKTHIIAADLVKNGIDISKLSDLLYHRRSFAKTVLIGKSLSNLKMFFNNKIAVIKITRELMDECGVGRQECDGIINYAREIDSVEVGVLISENDNDTCKIGLRSKEYIDVCSIAKAFKGGGHIRAAGCTINGNIDFAEKSILNEIEKALKDRNI